jgi:hypothetical protein
MIDRLNPGPGLADFWAEFKRPNRYRWPILGGSALLTASLMFLLTDHAERLNWAVGGVLALLAGIAVAAAIAEHVRVRVSVLAVAVVMTGVLLYQFTRERVRIPPPPAEVTYISTFEPGRTDAEIQASNLANQKEQERLKAEQARREEDVKDAYRALGRATGLDVDAMERNIADDGTEGQAASTPAGSPVAD